MAELDSLCVMGGGSGVAGAGADGAERGEEVARDEIVRSRGNLLLSQISKARSGAPGCGGRLCS